MTAGTFEVPMRDVSKKITLHIKVTGLRWFKARMTVGLWIMRLGAIVTGVNVEFSIDTK